MATLLRVMIFLACFASCVAVHAEERSSSLEALEMLGAGESVCSFAEEDRTLRYIGPTDDTAYRCFAAYAHHNGLILLVTSNGGDVARAMDAANFIDENDWSVSVLGMCASSCANYWIPVAAGLEVQPWSFILLHGSPDALNTRFASGDNAARHRAFAERHDIESAWFGNLGFGSFIAQLFGARIPPWLLSGPCHTGNHLEDLTVTRYWWPGDRQTYNEFRRLVSTYADSFRIRKCDRVAVANDSVEHESR